MRRRRAKTDGEGGEKKGRGEGYYARAFIILVCVGTGERNFGVGMRRTKGLVCRRGGEI